MIIRRAFIGDTAECLKWYPFALSKLKELKRGKKTFRPAPDIYIELKKRDHAGEILIMAEKLERETERRFLFVWVTDLRGTGSAEMSVGRLIDGISVYFIKRKGKKLVKRRVDLDFVYLDWNNKKVKWLYGGQFQCARFDLANPDQFVAVFKRTEGEGDSKTGYITTVRFKLVKNKDGRMEIWEVSRSEFSYPSYTRTAHEYGSEWWLLGSKLIYVTEERTYIDYDVVDIYVKGDTIKYLGLYHHKYNYHDTKQHYSLKGGIPFYFKGRDSSTWWFDGWVFDNKDVYTKWIDEYGVFFGGFNSFVYEWGRGAQATITHITTSADAPGNWAQADYWEIILNKGSHAYYPKAILNENSFLYVKISYTFDREEGYLLSEDLEGRPYNPRSDRLIYYVHPPMEVRMSNPDTLVDYGTEEMANYKVLVGGGGRIGDGGAGGWSGMRGTLRYLYAKY